MKKTALTLILIVLLGCSTSEQLAKNKKKEVFTVFLIGDSTCAKKSDIVRPETGWGEKLPLFFENGITIDNRAQNGRSSKSFFNEGHWGKIMEVIKEGDWVLIQFGHNDGKKDDPLRGTTMEEYKNYLSKYIDETRGKGATPVILTSIVRRAFKTGVLENTLGEYPKWAIEVAKSKNCEYIDTEKITRNLIAGLGEDQSKLLYFWATKQEFPHLAADKKDNTHLNPEGAQKVAGLIVEEIKKLKNETLAKALK